MVGMSPGEALLSGVEDSGYSIHTIMLMSVDSNDERVPVSLNCKCRQSIQLTSE